MSTLAPALAGGVPPARVLPSTRREWQVVLAFLVIAVALRVGVVLATRDTYVNQNDAVQYDLIASSIARGDGYGDTTLFLAEGPSALRGPVYPLFLASLYVVLGEHSWTAGRLANAGFGAVLVALVGVLATMLLGRRVGLLALGVAAVHPTLILFGSALMLDVLLAALVLGSVIAALQHQRAPRGLRWPMLAGALVGLAFLTKETGAVAALPVLLILWGSRPSGERPWRAVGAAALLAIALVVPWTVRNASALAAFVPGSTTGGHTLAGTYNDTSRHNPDFPAIWLYPARDPEMAAVIAEIDPPTEVALDRELSAAAFDYIRANPEYVPVVLFWNTVRLFDLQGPRHALFYAPFVPYPRSLTWLAVFASYAVYAAALFALARGALRSLPRWFWSYPALATLLFAAVTGAIRYRATIEPFLVVAAAAGVRRLLDDIADRRTRRP